MRTHAVAPIRAHSALGIMPRGRCRGLTVIELATVLAVIGVVAAIGAPSLMSTLSATRTASISNRLLADLSLARTRAIMSALPGEICPSSDASTCSGSTDWSDGWIVFVDADGDARRSGSEPVISAASRSELGGFSVTTSEGRAKVRFRPDGRNAGTNVSMRLCEGGALRRSIVINISGRSRIVRPGAADGPCT